MIDLAFHKAEYGFKFVYVWVINDETSMRDYLRMGVDGIFVDVGNESKLKNILEEKEFEESIYLAGRDVNLFPWVQPNFLNFEGNITGKPITNLKVQALDKIGPKPEEGWNFYPTNLNTFVVDEKYEKYIYVGYQIADQTDDLLPITSIDFKVYDKPQSNQPSGWEWDGSNLNADKQGNGSSETRNYIYLVWKKE